VSASGDTGAGSLEGRAALVTGASRGIGAAIATALARRGARVTGTATSAEGAERIGERLAGAGLHGRGEVLDVSDPDSVAALVARLEAAGDVPEVLVNNAGVARDGLLMRMRDDDWEAVIGTNLSSVYRMCKACVRGMIKARYGRIVNITSVVGATGNAGQTSYAAAKAGVVGFTRSLARELAARNVTVNAVAPGFIDTDMTRALPETQRAALLAGVPLGRLGTAEEVAAATVFLASPEAGYITGEVLHVNGGMFMG